MAKCGFVSFIFRQQNSCGYLNLPNCCFCLVNRKRHPEGDFGLEDAVIWQGSCSLARFVIFLKSGQNELCTSLYTFSKLRWNATKYYFPFILRSLVELQIKIPFLFVNGVHLLNRLIVVHFRTFRFSVTVFVEQSKLNAANVQVKNLCQELAAESQRCVVIEQELKAQLAAQVCYINRFCVEAIWNGNYFQSWKLHLHIKSSDEYESSNCTRLLAFGVVITDNAADGRPNGRHQLPLVGISTMAREMLVRAVKNRVQHSNKATGTCSVIYGHKLLVTFRPRELNWKCSASAISTGLSWVQRIRRQISRRTMQQSEF